MTAEAMPILVKSAVPEDIPGCSGYIVYTSKLLLTISTMSLPSANLYFPKQFPGSRGAHAA